MKKALLYFAFLLIAQPVLAAELFGTDGATDARAASPARECRTFLTSATATCSGSTQGGRFIAGLDERHFDSGNAIDRSAVKKNSSPIFAILYIPPSDYSSLSSTLGLARNTLEQTLNSGERTASSTGAMWGIGAYIPFK